MSQHNQQFKLPETHTVEALREARQAFRTLKQRNNARLIDVNSNIFTYFLTKDNHGAITSLTVVDSTNDKSATAYLGPKDALTLYYQDYFIEKDANPDYEGKYDSDLKKLQHSCPWYIGVDVNVETSCCTQKEAEEKAWKKAQEDQDAKRELKEKLEHLQRKAQEDEYARQELNEKLEHLQKLIEEGKMNVKDEQKDVEDERHTSDNESEESWGTMTFREE